MQKSKKIFQGIFFLTNSNHILGISRVVFFCYRAAEPSKRGTYSLALLLKPGVTCASFALSQTYPYGNDTLSAGQGLWSFICIVTDLPPRKYHPECRARSPVNVRGKGCDRYRLGTNYLDTGIAIDPR